MPITMKPAASSNVHSTGYEAATKTLAVRFHNGDTWHYVGVPQELADRLERASSVGSFLHAHIKSKFAGSKQ